MRRIAASIALAALTQTGHVWAANSGVPRHVMTADFLGAPYGSTLITPKRAAPYLTWAQVTVRNANAVAAAGVKTQYYIDPTLTIANRGDQMYTSDESTFAHDCIGNRVTIQYHSLTENLMAVDQPSMRDVFHRWVTRVTSIAHFDALFEDDASPPSEYMHFRLLPCRYDDAAWLEALDGLNHTSPIPVIVGGLNASRRPEPSAAIALLSSDKTLGMNYEHCFSGQDQAKLSGAIWQATENSELRTAAAHKLFQCTARNGTDAARAIDARIYLYASFMLAFDPASGVIWEEYATPSRFRVEPESELVPLSPLRAAPANVSGLKTSGGAYAREYARCYLAGRFVGACACAVNSDRIAHPLPLSGYRHTLVLKGGGVLDGGTISFDGPPPPAQLPPASAVIVLR